MANDKRMTAAEFEAVTKSLTRMDKDSIAAARLVLVDGRMQKEVAGELGLTKQRLSSIVGRIEKEKADVPAGWLKVEVWLPPEAAEEVRSIEKRAREVLAE